MRRILVVPVVALLVAGCGGSSSDDSSDRATVPDSTDAQPTTIVPTSEAAPPSEETTPTDPPVPPSTEAPTGPSAATSLEQARDGVVRIVGTGTFADPDGGMQVNVPGSGSGFIIDPSGLAVTNNHVVTGAAVLEVFLADEDQPRNARVVAVSECSDLAVIDIDGEGYPYLDWYEGEVVAGMPIFAAGYPLGSEEYTVLDGVVSKESAGGESTWASIDAVIEHSADTLPGNSGGPIVTDTGAVVAVNYAGNDAGQSFAVGSAVARPIVETLSGDVDVNSIGINGEALFDGDASGIWVFSVQSGSPADVAGVEAGDLLLSMESVVLATDGTMSDYCDILRSHIATDTLDIEVYRPDTDQILEGQLNGRELEVVTSFEAEFDDVVEDDVAGFEYTEYVTITDESALISVSVPAEWSETDGRIWSTDLATGVEEDIGPALSAAPDLELFRDAWGTPGVFIGASPLFTGGVEEILNRYDFTGSCVYDARYDYDDGVYTGAYDLYTDCGAEGSVFFQVIAGPASQTWLASVQIVVVSDADLVAADEIFNTFFVEELAG